MAKPDRSSELGQGVIVDTRYDHVCKQDPTSNRRWLQIAPYGPFRLDLTAWALRRHARNAVDRWDAATYTRVMSLDDGPVALSVTQVAGPDAPRLSVLLAGRPIDTPAEDLARSALNALLGLTVDLSRFAAMAASDPLLGPLARRMRGVRPPRFPTVFEALVNGVACQQLSLAVGIQLLNRLVADRGKATSDIPAGSRAFPDPEDLASLEPADLKAPRVQLHQGSHDHRDRPGGRRRRSRLGGTRTGRGWRGDRAPDQPARHRALDAEYVLLRGLGRLHIFPGDDVGAHTKLRHLFGIDVPLDHQAVQRLVARWHPYAGVVYFHLLLDSLSRAGLVDQS